MKHYRHSVEEKTWFCLLCICPLNVCMLSHCMGLSGWHTTNPVTGTGFMSPPKPWHIAPNHSTQTKEVNSNNHFETLQAYFLSCSNYTNVAAFWLQLASTSQLAITNFHCIGLITFFSKLGQNLKCLDIARNKKLLYENQLLSICKDMWHSN